MDTTSPVPSHSYRRLRWATLALGISLGGFFDGILLHQILQWHHLLSGVDTLRDVRVQILADGLFHALMYVIGGVALCVLWRSRSAFVLPMASRLIWTQCLLGFGLWHVADTLLSHWLSGIHRIRDDASNPLFWDVLWLVVFGLVPIAAALLMRRQQPPGNRGSGSGPAALLSAAVLVAGPIAAIPPADSDQTLVVFAPGVSAAQAFNALGSIDAQVVWSDSSGGVWIIRQDNATSRRKLYLQGALLVSGSSIGAGCATWSRV